MVCAILALTLFGLTASSAQASFGFLPGAEGFDVSATKEGGGVDLQAGSHPFQISTAINFKLAEGSAFTDGDLRDLHIELPPGLIENPAAVQQCTLAQFHTPRVSPFEASESGESCPDKSQIGVVAIHSSLNETRHFGLYNLAPPPGFPSQIGASPYGVPITLTPHVHQEGGEYGLTLDLRNFSQRFDLYGLGLTIWGTPWNITHNTLRGNCLHESDPTDPWGKCSIGRPKIFLPMAYLSLPPSCTGPLVTTVSGDSWQDPGSYLANGEPDLSDPAWVEATSLSHDEEGSPQGLSGCNQVAFTPETSGQLSTARAASPTGFDLNFEMRDEGLVNPKLTAPSQAKKAVVTLPEGMTINPSLAAGLGVCTPADYAAETVTSAPGEGCPNASKIGTFTVQSPLFEEPVAGSLFLAEPDNPATATAGTENPFDSLLALYIVAKAPQRGIMVKVAGKVELNHASGQLTATFDGLPQLPYSHFNVHFREGQRSPLLSPPSCGRYSTQIDLHPWLNPETVLSTGSVFLVTAGPEGTACPGGAAPPFSPGAQAGTLNSNAGSYSPFYLHLSRTDTEQEITSYSAKLAPGLLGKIAGIPYCPEADIEAAKHQSGTQETAHPSCPAASEVGHTVSGYGVGPVLAYAPGGLYLAGPFHGSAFSVVAIDAATVGPFDLGTIVVRSAIKVDPHTAQVSVDSAGSDPIPHILDGIPLHLRDIRVYMDRPNLTINPTSCNPFSVISSLTGSAAPFTNPAAATAAVPVGFQASNCSSLSFAPRFSLRLRGGTRRGNHPSLRAVVVPRLGDANIAKAAVALPPTEFLAQNHIQDVCTRSRLEAEDCPPGSTYGHVEAVTPLLEEPMRGPVYLGSGYGHTLPDLVAVLNGHGIRIVLDGRIDSLHGGLRGTFEGLPDAPVSKFTMVLNGGKRGILENERNTCASAQIATARFIGQNNEGKATSPRIGVRCKKPKRAKVHHRGGKR